MELHDIGPFDDAVLEFPESTGKGEVVLFEGPNGCGKTTIAEAIAVLVGMWGTNPLAGMLNGPLLCFPFGSFCRRLRGTCWTAKLTINDGIFWNKLVYQNNPAEPFAANSLAGFDPIPKPNLDARPNPMSWAPFAYKGHSPSADIACEGPRTIADDPMLGALSFGREKPASTKFGQFLINTEYERIQSKLYAAEKNSSEDASSFERLANSRHEILDRIQYALSRVLDRHVRIEFPVGHNAPRILFNDQEVPIDLLGEGMRNTISWLADLMIRLERINWADKERSPFDQDFWLILDEIEESLHPRMQARILPALRDLFPTARIYATTHSPFVVASAGEGTVFRIKPDPKTGRVSGKIEAVKLEHGQSLEWVVSEIFDAPSGFVDDETRSALDIHERGIRTIRAKQEVDWDGFTKARDFLLSLNEEVCTVVSMREVPVRSLIAEKLRERAA